MANFAHTVTTTPKAIASTLTENKRNRVTFSLPSSAGAAVYTGTRPDVTTSTGLPLYPGEERTYTGADARREFFAVVAAATETLRVEETE